MRPESSAASWLKFFTAAGINVEYAEHYAVTFSKNQIQLDMLPEINKDYLNDMGINLLGHVIAILRHAKLVYADEVKKSELPAIKKVDPKAPKPVKDPPKQTTNIKTSKAPPKPTEEYEKPTSSVAKRKSTVVQLPTSESSEPKIKVRKNLCDSSDDITTSRVKPPTNVRVNNDLISSDESRKGVFRRLGSEVNPTPETMELPTQPTVNNVDVFSRLGGKTNSLQSVQTTLPTKPIIQESTSVKPLVRKSIIRTRLDKPQVEKPKPLLVKQRVLPHTYMDREIQKTEKKVTSRLSNHSLDNKDIKSRLGHSFTKTITSQGSGSVKKVSFGTVSEKLIPKVNYFSHMDNQKISSQSFPASTRFAPNNRPSGVFSRLGTVPY